jgi:hypothetical protein
MLAERLLLEKSLARLDEVIAEMLGGRVQLDEGRRAGQLFCCSRRLSAPR